MNTGEGGLSPYHLAGGVDIIMQIGPALFGVRDEKGELSIDELKKKAAIPQVKAFELKLGQGAKTRGGHIDAEKVNPEVAEIRGVPPYQSIDSPNRFHQFNDIPGMFDFIDTIRNEQENQLELKLLSVEEIVLVPLAKFMKETGRGPDFISVDGGEGGTGHLILELIDSVGLTDQIRLTYFTIAH